MKKKSLYIIFTLSIIFLFNIKLDALVCTYVDPTDPKKDIVLDFSNDLHQAYVGNQAEYGLISKKPYQSCINPSTSTFKEIHLHSATEGGKTGSFSYGGKNWVFKKDYFEGATCFTNLNTYDEDANGNIVQKCPSLGFYERDGYTYITNKNKDVVCNNPGQCTNIVPKNKTSQIIDDEGNIIVNDYNRTCNYTLDLSNINGNKGKVTSELTITESPKGTFYVSIDGSEDVKLNLTGEYAFDVISRDLLSHVALKKEHLQKFIIMSDPENGTGLMCKTTPNYVYYDKSAGKYIVVPDKESIPSNITDWTGFGEYGDYDPIYGQLQGGDVQSKSGLCVDYLGSVSDGEESLAYFLDQIYSIIKIVSILITIVWCMLDLTKVIIHNKDELMNMVKKCAIRLVILLIILLLPTFIDMIGNLFGKEDILCGIK